MDILGWFNWSNGMRKVVKCFCGVYFWVEWNMGGNEMILFWFFFEELFFLYWFFKVFYICEKYEDD